MISHTLETAPTHATDYGFFKGFHRKKNLQIHMTFGKNENNEYKHVVRVDW